MADVRDFRAVSALKFAYSYLLKLAIGVFMDGTQAMRQWRLGALLAAWCAGNVYVAWSQFEGYDRTERIMLSRSTDQGSTFSRPITVAAGPNGGAGADLAVGPDGVVYIVWRSFRDEQGGDRLNGIWLARSTDQGASFGRPVLVSTIIPLDSFQFSGNGAQACGVLLPPCPSGFSFPRFSTFAAVAADQRGVHVVWTARRLDGQGKVLISNSATGETFPEPPAQIDQAPVGHQWFPDIASADGVLTALFYDSRLDPAYSPGRPPGNTETGSNAGDVVDVWVARSYDGGQSWAEERVTTASFNPNWTTFKSYSVDFPLAARPFMGDYVYVSAVPGRVWGVWADAREIVPGIPSIFLPFLPCDFSASFPSSDNLASRREV